MKKAVSLFLLGALLILSLSGCAGRGDDMSLEDILSSIQDNVPNLPEAAVTKVTDENFRYYLFIDPIKGSEALACDAVVSIVPHSVVLLRLPEGTDTDAVVRDIQQNVDLNKWVEASADTFEISAHNRTILLVMSKKDIVDKIISNFDNLWQ